ncbi:hypothetical protein [Sedimenticola sp.]|uniref:hypothetical protein n=1 Tax=Sedimenticola sp. TaxID=1940285 RepID=UPI003D11253F
MARYRAAKLALVRCCHARSVARKAADYDSVIQIYSLAGLAWPVSGMLDRSTQTLSFVDHLVKYINNAE